MTPRPSQPRDLPAPGLSSERSTVILGGGLAGLSAGYVLTNAEKPVTVLESELSVGGLSRTFSRDQFRYDLGGHRFITKNKDTEQFVKDVLNGQFLSVPRKSKIYMRNRFFDYPLKPSNAVFGLGMSTTTKAVMDYGFEKVKNFIRPARIESLEDWVISNFGRTLFDLYFRQYSEKVWGIECSRISKEWVSQRVRGLSLWVAMKNAFFKFSGREVDTLVDRFIYPRKGIGEISERMKEKIESSNSVLTSTRVVEAHHNGYRLEGVTVHNGDSSFNLQGKEFISSIPLTGLVKMLQPAPPREILDAASKLRYRDLVIVTVLLDRERVTDLTWLYLPERSMPLGRIHEPKNWSPCMAPDGKTHIVCEYFCFEGDRIWSSDDLNLKALTVNQLAKLGFIRDDEVIDTVVHRVPRAYPVFEVGYTEHYHKILGYLKGFENLHISGRGGMFRYYNIDRAIESGISAAESILEAQERAANTLSAGRAQNIAMSTVA